jgi:AcrR family transcriptional regulator
LAAAALAVLDREGAGGLSMRAVAAELRMSTMGLYRYVADRDELERLVVDLVLADLDLDVPADLPWQTRIEEVAYRVRVTVLRHPAAVPLLLSHRQDTNGSLRWGETMLGMLAEGGFDGVSRVIAFRALLSYVLGALQVQNYGALDGAGTKVLAELPVEHFPLLAQTARAAHGVDPEEEFRAGIRMLVRGLRQ